MSEVIKVLSDVVRSEMELPSDPRKGPLKTLWPMPRSMKIDMATIIKAIFDEYNFDVPVVTTGAFQAALMRDKQFKDRPVVVVQRASDAARRISLGEVDSVLVAKDVETGELLDVENVLKDAGVDPEAEIFLKNQVSDEVIDVWIFAENGQLIEQVYLLLKTAMFAAEKTFMETLGYLEFIRLTGEDGASLEQTGAGGMFVVFQRHLQYRGSHLDFIVGIGQVVELIAEQLSVTGATGSTENTVPVNLP